MSVKVLNDTGIGTTSSVVEGINWVVENLTSTGGLGIISMSMSGPPSLIIDSAVESAVAANVPVVVPAGNGNRDACDYSPGRVASARTVAGVGRYSHLSGSSNYGTCVDILAPSEGIMSTGLCSICVDF